MARTRKQLPILESVTVTDVAAEGKAIARVNDLVVFIPFVAPGDVVDVQLHRKKKNFAEGRVLHIHHYSEIRTEPICAHFGLCGGCKWQHLPYEAQLSHKEKQVYDNLVRLGKIELPEAEQCKPILGSVATQFYRNKLEYTFSNKRWMHAEEMQSGLPITDSDALGFHIPGMFDKVLDIKQCWLQAEPSNRIRLAVKAYCINHGYTFFDLRAQTGLMRNLIIRTSSTGEVMVIVVFFEEDEAKRTALMEHIHQEFPDLTALLYIINQKANDTIGDQQVHVYKGLDYILEQMGSLKFKIGPKSFYQTNSEQAHALYKVVRDFAQLKTHERVYDLYTGTGTIAQFVADQCDQVIGIEYVPEAIEDAKVNAQLNGINNTRFFAGDMKDLLTKSFIEEHGHPDVIITDPPRAGMHEDVVKTILSAAPDRIVYVSCNPATQARDLALLDCDYKLAKVQPVDLFPHTQHVENVVLLLRR